MPPPRTRSSSPMPLGNRTSLSCRRAVTGLAFRGRSKRTLPLFRSPAAARLGCSTMVFQAPQAGHFPAQRLSSLPQSVQ